MSPTRTAPTIRCPSWRGSSPRSTRSHLDDGTDAFPPSNLEFTAISTPTQAQQRHPRRGDARSSTSASTISSAAPIWSRMVEEIAAREAPGATVEREISGEAFLTPPGAALRPGRRRRSARRPGIEPELSTSGGTSDGRFLIAALPGGRFRPAQRHACTRSAKARGRRTSRR